MSTLDPLGHVRDRQERAEPAPGARRGAVEGQAGLIGFTLIVLIILRRSSPLLIAPYDPAAQSVVGAPQAAGVGWPRAIWSHLLGTDQARPRHPLPPDLRGAHLAHRRLRGGRAGRRLRRHHRPARRVPRRPHRHHPDAARRHPGRVPGPPPHPAHRRGHRLEHEHDDHRARADQLDDLRPGGARHRAVRSARRPGRRGGGDDRRAAVAGDLPAHPAEPRSPLLTLGILEFTNIVLAEAALSFLGLGVQPPATSWGLDISTGKDYIFVAWWLVTFPGLCISITVLSINLFANWLRVTTDPAGAREALRPAPSAARRRESAGPAFTGRPHERRRRQAAPRDRAARSSVRHPPRRGPRAAAASTSPSAAARRWPSSANRGRARASPPMAVMGLIDVPRPHRAAHIRWRATTLLDPCRAAAWPARSAAAGDARWSSRTR